MRNVAQLLGFRKKPSAPKQSAVENTTIRLLAITNDDPFYSCLHSTATTCGWEIIRAGTVAQGLEALSARRLPLVVFDSDLFEGEWGVALERISAHPSKPCVLLASRVFDENLFREVTQHGGFHVLLKSAGGESRIRDLRFALFWRMHAHAE
jgi:hypothetical protein